MERKRVAAETKKWEGQQAGEKYPEVYLERLLKAMMESEGGGMEPEVSISISDNPEESDIITARVGEQPPLQDGARREYNGHRHEKKL